MKKILKFLFHRVVLVALALALQAGLLVLMLVKFNEYFVYFYAICIALSLAAVLKIVNGDSNPGYKIAWIIPILLVPVFGVLFYIILGGKRLSRQTKAKMRHVEVKMRQELPPQEGLLDEIRLQNEDAAVQVQYIQKYAYSPVYKNTYTEYLPIGEVKFERLKEELAKARHYIFLEYFIVQEGVMWDAILEILKEKVKQGVEVRMIYDDMGCIMTLPYRYDRRLEALGIQCCVFNPFVPVLTSRLNNRDHRKICVIDGHTGFTGGINLADEYINVKELHGHWKDTAIMLRGEAVWSLTVMFLTMWDFIKGEEADFDLYRPQVYQRELPPDDGYIQPFADNPLDDEPVGENVYLNMISRAKKYVYITTPYLIPSNEMMTALCNAARSGVDVRIITPHIPDKWYVHMVSRAHYSQLVEAGVRIFEYTPGFIHAKSFVADGLYAVVGTINLDYRSLYLHFECATWMYGASCIQDIYRDFLETEAVSQEITLEQCRAVPFHTRIARNLLKMFAPLM